MRDSSEQISTLRSMFEEQLESPKEKLKLKRLRLFSRGISAVGRSEQKRLGRRGDEAGSESGERPWMQRRSDGAAGRSGGAAVGSGGFRVIEEGGEVGSSHRRACGFADGLELLFTIALSGYCFRVSVCLFVSSSCLFVLLCLECVSRSDF